MVAPVISHLLGTITLLGIMVVIVAVFLGAQLVINMNVQELRLTEVAESVARELVELASVHTLGGSGVSIMHLTVPQEIYGQGYTIELENIEGERIIVRVRLQIYQVIRVVVVPNFGKSSIEVVSGEVSLPGLGTTVSPRLLLPIPPGSGERRPALVAFSQDDTVYLGFAIVEG